MPSRKIVADELADALRQMSHPDRIRIIFKLQAGDQTVKDLAQELDLPATRASQHLAVLRAISLVETPTRGQNRVYRLAQPELAHWLIGGIDFIAHRLGKASAQDIDQAKELWQQEAAETVI
ncbi:MAG: winged helix-turn-helix transcriptional regulator [Erythrobacter sp.]|nr:winged helix-turn-helix transcriptional regulator [Erythrobacter sp.]